jgi:hypothetical protein
MTAPDGAVEAGVRALAEHATDARPEGAHVGEPLLALMRDGDTSDDIADALGHVARCADCRARLTEGHVARRSLVVVAIEAPKASKPKLAKAAEGVHARLVERGAGRFTAVVDAERAQMLRGELEKPESSLVNRLAVGTPFEVPMEELRAARASLSSRPDGIPVESGTEAAELRAWSEVARRPVQRVSSFSLAWLAFAVVTIGGAMAIAYSLAVR